MKRGDKVVCISAGKWQSVDSNDAKPSGPEKDEISTVSGVDKMPDGRCSIDLEEYQRGPDGNLQGFLSTHFRKVHPAFKSTMASKELANKPLIKEIVEQPKKKEYDYTKN